MFLQADDLGRELADVDLRLVDPGDALAQLAEARALRLGGLLERVVYAARYLVEALLEQLGEGPLLGLQPRQHLGQRSGLGPGHLVEAAGKLRPLPPAAARAAAVAQHEDEHGRRREDDDGEQNDEASVHAGPFRGAATK